MRRLFLGSVLLVLLALGASAYAFGAPGYDGPASGHFDGEVFHNQAPLEPKSFLSVIWWRLSNPPAPWPDYVDAPPGPKPRTRVGIGELRVTYVNHATVLVQVDGVNILTDPHFSERIGPYGIGPKRQRPPGVRFEDLPPIDLVLISHNHYDHLDLDSLARLDRAFRPRIVAGLGTRALLEGAGLDRAYDLDWWQTARVDEHVRVTAVPSQHWSRRGLSDAFNTLWAAYVIEGKGGPIYFAGDTGFGPHFEQAFERFGPMRLALLPIGAYEPRWFMKEAHISPEEAADAHRVLRAQTSVAIHFGTFRLGNDGPEDGPRALREYVAMQPDFPGEFWVLGFGEARDVPPLEPPRSTPAVSDAQAREEGPG